jgi:hypothetical protein
MQSKCKLFRFERLAKVKSKNGGGRKVRQISMSPSGVGSCVHTGQGEATGRARRGKPYCKRWDEILAERAGSSFGLWSRHHGGVCSRQAIKYLLSGPQISPYNAISPSLVNCGKWDIEGGRGRLECLEQFSRQ